MTMNEKHVEYIDKIDSKIKELEEILRDVKHSVEREEIDPMNHKDYWEHLWWCSLYFLFYLRYN